MMRDLLLALRTLGRQPAFTALAVVILGLGLGATTAMLSLVDALIMRPLPYPDSENIVKLARTRAADGADTLAAGSFLDYREQSASFAGLAALAIDGAVLGDTQEGPQMVWGARVTADFFPVFQVPPRLGRVLGEGDFAAGAAPVAVLSARVWRSRYGGDPTIVGRRARISGQAVTVVGVMPDHFTDPTRFWGRPDVWQPLTFWPGAREDRRGGWLRVIGRLRPGLSLAAARAEVATVAARLDAAHDTRTGADVVPLRRVGGIGAAAERVAWLTTGVALFLLMLACSNLAGIQLARLAARAHDRAIRVALGASRARLVRQSLLESLLLSLAGSALGLLIAQGALALMGPRLTFGAVRFTVGLPVALDGRILVAALLLMLVTTVLVGTLPAWLGSHAGIGAALRRGGRGATDQSRPRLRQALVVVQMALALVLLAAGGLFVRGLDRFVERGPGWRVDGLLAGQLPLNAGRYPDEKARAAFVERMQRRLAALPGTAGTALSSRPLPMQPLDASHPFAIAGAAPSEGSVLSRFVASVSPDYFATLGISLREGRLFDGRDRADTTPVVIINEAMARRLWPGRSPLGQRIGPERGPSRWTIVGVVSDVSWAGGLGEARTRFQSYHPIAQMTPHSLTVIVRGPPALAPEIRRAVAELDAELPVDELKSARELVDVSLANFALVGWVLSGFAILGLVLSALGVYGLFSGLVVERTQEIGVRMALGAQAGQVLRMILGKGARLALTGAALGVAGGLGVAPALTAAASELPARDPGAVAALALLLVAVALFACWLPARRAAALDPMVALRQEG